MGEKENIEISKSDRILAEYFRVLVVDEKLYLYRDLNLSDLARLMETKRSYLSQAVNRVFGKSFTVFVNELRIEESIRIMQEQPRLTVGKLTHKAGFNDRTTFYRVFKQVKGMVPSEYREKERSMEMTDNENNNV